MKGKAHPALLLALAIVALAVVGPLRTGAVFTDSPPVPGNTFSASGCFQARVNQVLTGQTTSSANGTVTVVIAAVDPTKSFLMFGTRHNLNRPVGSEVRGRIASSTSLEFVRVTNEGAPVTITIRWYVVEYACGVTVQRGQVAQTATSVDIPINPVASLSQAFVTWSKTADQTDTTWDQNDPVVMELASTSNLQLRVNSASANDIIWWQVVEFTNPSDISVQRGTTSLTGATLSTTAAIPTAVTVARTFILVDYQTSGTGPDIGARMLRARLSNATTITLDRSVSGSPDDITEIQWQAVELKDGSRVQRGSANLPNGTGAVTVGLSTIDPSRAAAFASVQSGGGQNTGRSPYVASPVLGVGAVTATLTATQVTLTRTSTAAATDIGWFVVEWGGPFWWSAAYDWRKAITVNAGAAAVPNGYSVSLTFNHRALVTAGKALANGDDLRVVHWNGAVWTELDRVLEEGSGWNLAATRIWFKSQAAIATNGSDGNYFLYYGNSSPGSPPANPSNVFFFYDSYPGAILGPSYTVLRPPAAGWSVGGGQLNINQDPNENFWAATNTATLFHTPAPPVGDFEAQARQLGRPTADGNAGGVLAYQDDDNYIANYHDNIGGAESLEYVREAAGAPTSETQAVNSDPIYLRIQKLGTTYTGSYSTNGGLTFNAVGTPQVITLTPIQIGLTAFSSTGNVRIMNFDNFRVRLLVNPAPTTAQGIEDRS
jgi:beta-xylosidase-like protein